ncbi:MAG: SEC-C domain-containing protein [Gammaproteobacteria bacterium]|nr:SEC-C domain-containing protein [Gammaproteobacteria bacterium]
MNSGHRGKVVEDIVQKICIRMFLDDFVVKNPSYKKRSGHIKEAADILIPFGDNLIVYQVKSKIELKKASEKTDLDYKRIEKKVNDAISQFKAIKEAIEHKLIIDVENSRGIKIPFQSDKFTKIIGLVVLDLNEEKFPDNERTAIYGGFTSKYQIAIHIFLREELELIASEIDTLPDFIKYLKAREFLYNHDLISNLTPQRDILALHLTRPEISEELIANKVSYLAIEPNTWENYIRIKNSNKQHKQSPLIDNIINWIHKSIDYYPEFIHEIPRNDFPQGSVENYFKTVTELASLTRAERNNLGWEFLDVMNNVDSSRKHLKKVCYIVINEKAILIFSTKAPRVKRAKDLIDLATMLYCKLNLKKVIGIATENVTSKDRSYDFIVLENVFFKNHEEILDKANKIFNNNSILMNTESVIKKKHSRKVNKLGRNDICSCGSGLKFKRCCLGKRDY